MDMVQLLSAQRGFATARTMEPLKKAFANASRRLGFHSDIDARRVPTNFIDAQVSMVDGYPDGWAKRCIEAQYCDPEPVMAWCLCHRVPICWRDLTLEAGSQAQTMMLDGPPARAHAITVRERECLSGAANEKPPAKSPRSTVCENQPRPFT